MVEYIVIAEDDGCSKGCCRGWRRIVETRKLIIIKLYKGYLSERPLPI